MAATFAGNSVPEGAALFSPVAATTARSDFVDSCITGYRSSPSRHGPAMPPAKPKSARTIAPSGLRRMPTSPLSSLRFRTAGCPDTAPRLAFQTGPFLVSLRLSQLPAYASRDYSLHLSFALSVSSDRPPFCASGLLHGRAVQRTCTTYSLPVLPAQLKNCSRLLSTETDSLSRYPAYG